MIALAIPAFSELSADTFIPRKKSTVQRQRLMKRKAVKRAAAPAVAPVPAPKPNLGNVLPNAAPEPAEARVGEQTTARIEAARRRVEVQTGGSGWKKAVEKTPLKFSDELRTGPNSTARVKLADGSKILLLQNSQAQMENLSSVEKTIKLVRGRVRAIVAHIRGGNNFKIKTPVGVASVRGTDFEVGFLEDTKEMSVDVKSGSVFAARLGDLGQEVDGVLLNPGEGIKFGMEGEMGDVIQTGAVPKEKQDIKQDIRKEMQIEDVKDNMLALAAQELKNADYQQGKALIDVHGGRVRLEQYITRPRDDQFKLVVLNERDNRFDYFTYLGTFNKALPDDLSIALRDANGKLGDIAPEYFLTSYETETSNSLDKINEAAAGGHRVKIEIDDSGENWLLTDAETGNTREIPIVSASGNDYEIYNPIADQFVTVSGNDVAEARRMAVLDPDIDAYREFVQGDTYWSPRFNTYSLSLTPYGGSAITKIAYASNPGVTNTLAIDLDATFSAAPVATLFKSDPQNIHDRMTLVFDDGSTMDYDTYLFDDEGVLASRSGFAGLSTNAEYKEELLKWNYEQDVVCSEASGPIHIVFAPEMAIQAGLIK